MATTELIISEQAFCLRPCSVASAFVKAPLVIALPAAFMDLIGDNMIQHSRNQCSGKQQI